MKKLIILSLSLLLSSAALAKVGAGNSEAAQQAQIDTQAAAKADKAADKAAKNAAKADKDKGKNRAAPQDPTMALAAQERHTDALLEQPDVVGTAVSWNGTGEAVIKVYVARKTSNIPQSLDNIPVVVERVGTIYATNIPCENRPDGEGCRGLDAALAQDGGTGTEAMSSRDWQVRPVPIGVSVGDASSSPGTLGCRVSRGCHNYALTNAHVVAEPEQTLIQPSAPDGGLNPDNAIGSLHDSVPIIFGTSASTNNRVDAAIFKVNAKDVGTTTRSNGYGEPKFETLNPALAMQVMKYGRSSAMTSGYIDAINATVIVSYANGDARFVNQIIIKSATNGVDFSLPGDSGSLVVASGGDDDRKPVGLLFASGRQINIANPINEVLMQLDVDIDGEF